MMDTAAEVWTDKHQRKSREKEGSHKNSDALQKMIAQTPLFSCDVCGVNVNTRKGLGGSKY